MVSVSQITHSGVFDTGTVAIVTTQVARLKGLRLGLGIQVEGVQAEGLWAQAEGF